jgi:dynein heavy chain
VEEWSEQKQGVVGDCVLCSGIIAYLGAFPLSYRDDTISEWAKLLG